MTSSDSTSKVSLSTEIVGGVTTFLTVSYIVVVNPSILATAGTGMEFSGVLTATVLLAFTMTLAMGVYARIPFAVAPGMGINAFVAFGVILGQKVPWQIAMGMIFWAGVLFLALSVLPLREKLAQAIPATLRTASACGIGLFLAFIGLKNSGLVVADTATFVRLGKIGGKELLAVFGLLGIGALQRRKNPLAFLIGISFCTLVSWALGWVALPKQLWSAPDFSSVFFKLDPLGALQWTLLPTIVSVMFTDLFDSVSTFVGVAQATGLVDKSGQPLRLRQGLIVDAWATLCAGLFGTSSGTAYIESAAGVEAGARTGRAAIVTAICFLPCFFLGPLVAMVPAYATAPALILVGASMFRSVSHLRMEHWEDALPAFLTIILMPLTFSITQGILWGFVSHLACRVLAGRARELRLPEITVGAVCLLLLIIEHWPR